ncbi:hypothetical protein AGMMS49579_13550 [Spirochaetia bacterium]|nr:hypothetical protein AGMMS49579_13550 [Spirochaetia bacterium]
MTGENTDDDWQTTRRIHDLAKEKAPALARSDSHEVGHAEGMEEDMAPQKATMAISDDLVGELRQRAGV